MFLIFNLISSAVVVLGDGTYLSDQNVVSTAEILQLNINRENFNHFEQNEDSVSTDVKNSALTFFCNESFIDSVMILIVIAIVLLFIFIIKK